MRSNPPSKFRVLTIARPPVRSARRSSGSSRLLARVNSMLVEKRRSAVFMPLTRAPAAATLWKVTPLALAREASSSNRRERSYW